MTSLPGSGIEDYQGGHDLLFLSEALPDRA